MVHMYRKRLFSFKNRVYLIDIMEHLNGLCCPNMSNQGRTTETLMGNANSLTDSHLMRKPGSFH